MIEFTVDTSEIDHLAKLMPWMAEVIAEEMKAAMDESGLLLTGLVADRTPVNYGILRSSIEFPQGYVVRGTPVAEITGTIAASKKENISGASAHEYANYVEFGTRPHFPPVAPLILWALRKFGVGVDEAYEIARGVQFRIAARGTEGVHMFRDAWQLGGKTKVQGFFRQVPVKAIRRYSSR